MRRRADYRGLYDRPSTENRIGEHMTEATEKPKVGRPRRGPRPLVWLVRLAVAAVFLAFNLVTFGRVEGFEFSPDTCKLRSFTYWQIPLINVQVLPASRARISTKLEAYLSTAGFLSQNGDKEQRRWDVVSARGSQIDYESDAEIIRQYLLLHDSEGQHPWVEWSKQHPEAAKVLWPQVLDSIRRRHYILVPRQLELAKSTESAGQLSSALDRLGQDSAKWLAELNREQATADKSPASQIE